MVLGTENITVNTNSGSCGWKHVVINKNGIVNSFGGFIGDNGTTDVTHPYAHNKEYRFQADSCIRGNRQTGEYVLGVCLFQVDVYKNILSASGVTLPAAFNYWRNESPVNTAGGNNQQRATFQRFARNGTPVSIPCAGRNIPAGDEMGGSDPDWVGGVVQKPAGCGILSDGNTFYGMCTRSSNQITGSAGSNEIKVFIDPNRAAVDGTSNPNYGTGNDDVTVFSITNPAASSFVKSTTAAFQTRKQPQHYYGPTAPGFLSPKSEAPQGGGSDYINGWFALYQDEMIAVYNNAGSLIAYATNTNADNNPNGNCFKLPENIVNAGDPFRGSWFDRDQDVAVGGNRIARLTYVFDSSLSPGGKAITGVVRRMVMLWKVDPTAGKVTPFPGILPDDDFNGGTGPNANPGNNDIYRTSAAIDVDEDGSFVVAWRTAENNAVVCRVYDANGNPLTSSFYVSSLEDPTTDDSANLASQDGSKLEVAKSGNTICVVWTTDNGVTEFTTVDCYGAEKALAATQVARLFQTTNNPTHVKDWDLFE